MQLQDDWKLVLRKAWSIRFILLAGFFSGLEALVQVVTLFVTEIHGVPRGLFAILAFVASNGAFVTRLIAQRNLTTEKDQQ
jgi:hypothetical protein